MSWKGSPALEWLIPVLCILCDLSLNILISSIFRPGRQPAKLIPIAILKGSDGGPKLQEKQGRLQKSKAVCMCVCLKDDFAYVISPKCVRSKVLFSMVLKENILPSRAFLYQDSPMYDKQVDRHSWTDIFWFNHRTVSGELLFWSLIEEQGLSSEVQ